MSLSDQPPLSPFSPEPAMDLKGKGMPWPVYLAIGLAVAGVIAFLALRSYKDRERRKVHVAFMEQFADFEKNDVNAFWRCLFGKEGDGRRFTLPEALNGQLESALFTDPKNFPEKVQAECVPKALAAAKKAKDFSPLPPPEYDQALDKYSKTLSGLANALNVWAEGAPKRIAARLEEQKLKAAGDAWSGTGNPRKPDPQALVYDRFLHCAVPNIDGMKEGQELLEFLAGNCVGKHTNPDYLVKLRDKCLPEASQPAPGKPSPAFLKVLQKINDAYDREQQAWDACFRAMRKLAKKDDLEGFDRAWVESLNASTEVRKIGKEQLQDGSEPAAPTMPGGKR